MTPSVFAMEAPSSLSVQSYADSLPAGPVFGYGFSNILAKIEEGHAVGRVKLRGLSAGLTLGYMQPFGSRFF